MAKSPIYGLSRNWNKRKSQHPSAANVNMHGKKSKRMSCGCCFCFDFREKLKYKEDMKEIKNAGYGVLVA